MEQVLALREQLAEERRLYEQAVATKPIAESAPHKRRIRELQRKISVEISANANPCSKCGKQPVGAHHPHPSFEDQGVKLKRKQRQAYPYEIKCLQCVQHASRKAPQDVERFSVRSTSAAAATAEWNELHPVKKG